MTTNRCCESKPGTSQHDRELKVDQKDNNLGCQDSRPRDEISRAGNRERQPTGSRSDPSGMRLSCSLA